MHCTAPQKKAKLLPEVLRTGVTVTASRGVLLSRRHFWPQVLHPALHCTCLHWTIHCNIPFSVLHQRVQYSRRWAVPILTLPFLTPQMALASLYCNTGYTFSFPKMSRLPSKNLLFLECKKLFDSVVYNVECISHEWHSISEINTVVLECHKLDLDWYEPSSRAKLSQ